jgi:hypothetical protein
MRLAILVSEEDWEMKGRMLGERTEERRWSIGLCENVAKGNTNIVHVRGLCGRKFDNRVSEEEIGDGFDRWVQRRSKKKKMAISVMTWHLPKASKGKINSDTQRGQDPSWLIVFAGH